MRSKTSLQRTYGVGYFARANEDGHTAKWTKTHCIASGKGTCLCGYRPHKTMKYQFCAARIELDYIECSRCLERAKNLVMKRYDKKKD